MAALFLLIELKASLTRIDKYYYSVFDVRWEWEKDREGTVER
jgi:hypothetical protein